MRQLIIGNKNYSTWSFRAWWTLKRACIPFDEVRVPLYTGEHNVRLRTYSPTGLVPILVEDEMTIWDSLAICEYVAEAHPGLWPADRGHRARARSLCAEMHSGFQGIRAELHMNCRAGLRTLQLSDRVKQESGRIAAIVDAQRGTHHEGGPWLFGDFSITDAMIAPFVFSLVTYQVPTTALVHAYHEALMQDPWVRVWFDDAAQECETIELCEAGA